MTYTITNEFWRDLADTAAQAKPVLMADFLHTRSHLWPQVKADAADNNDHLAILNAALLVRNKKWDVTTTLTKEWNAMRCRPVALHECRTDAERDAWQVGFEHGARSDFTGGNNPEDLLEGLQPDLHEIAQQGWWAGNAMQRMPWTRDCLTREQFDAWLVSRKEAGRGIDIETCELGRWKAYDCDVYGARELPREMQQVGTNRYVRSPTSNGWINEEDLPVWKYCAMYDRIQRRRRLWEAACAAHPQWEAAGYHNYLWEGDGEEPSPDELIEWFKVNHPVQASEAESKIRRELEIEREQKGEWSRE